MACNTEANVDTKGRLYTIDLTKTFASQYSEPVPNGTQFRVDVASESQAYLDANYRGLTHPVAVNTVVRWLDGNWAIVMGQCYPTDCVPCVEPIEFPKNPADGERFCGPADSSGNRKCWFYDKCVPGWRAEGPNAAAVAYKGAINVCTQDPHENPKAGDFYVQNTSCSNIRTN